MGPHEHPIFKGKVLPIRISCPCLYIPLAFTNPLVSLCSHLCLPLSPLVSMERLADECVTESVSFSCDLSGWLGDVLLPAPFLASPSPYTALAPVVLLSLGPKVT